MIAIRPTTVNSSPRHGEESVPDVYSTLLNRLCGIFSQESEPCLVGVTSCVRGEGVSTVSANLAAAAAAQSSQRPVLLVDANFSHPALHEIFGVPGEPGAAEVVAEKTEWREAIRPGVRRGLDVLVAGAAHGFDPRSAEVAATLGELCHEWRSIYEMVVIDLPAISDGEMNVSLSQRLDGVVLVVEAERVPWQVGYRAKELLDHSRVRVLGAVFNKRIGHVPEWLYRRI